MPPRIPDDELAAKGCVLSYNALLQQRDDLIAASRKMLPYCDSTGHGRRAAGELTALIKRIEEQDGR